MTVTTTETDTATPCPECQGTQFVRMMTLNKKYCANCGHWLEWPLRPGEPPIFNSAARWADEETDDG